VFVFFSKSISAFVVQTNEAGFYVLSSVFKLFSFRIPSRNRYSVFTSSGQCINIGTMYSLTVNASIYRTIHPVNLGSKWLRIRISLSIRSIRNRIKIPITQIPLRSKLPPCVGECVRISFSFRKIGTRNPENEVCPGSYRGSRDETGSRVAMKDGTSTFLDPYRLRTCAVSRPIPSRHPRDRR